MPKKTLLDRLEEFSPGLAEDILKADGFDDAAIGVAERCGQPAILVYDAEKCISILMKRDKMTREEAEEFFSFNTEGAWVGKKTPAYVWKLP